MTSAQQSRAKASRGSAIVRSFTVAVLALGGQVQAATVTRTGTVKVSGTIAVAGVPTTATLSCGVNISTQTAGHNQSIAAAATCTRTGNRATIALSLPYTFLFDRAGVSSAMLNVSVGASAFASTGFRVSTGTEYVVRLPASGATIPVVVKLAL